MEIKFKKVHPDAKLPYRNSVEQPGTENSGFDVYAVEDKIIPARGSAKVDTGLQFAYITPGYWVRVESRSGLGFNKGILAFNGIIDQPWRGDAGVKLINTTDQDYEIKKGDRICQFVVYPLIPCEISESDEVEETYRGDKGLGSSGR